MTWWEIAVVTHADEAAIDLAMAMWPQLDYALQADDAGRQLLVYGEDSIPEALNELLAELGVPAEPRWLHDTDLAVAAADAVELAPGVWALGPDQAEPPQAVGCVRVAAACAFGDGAHATTGMLAGRLVSQPPAGLRVLDLGCGSGLLGLLALTLGATSCAFTDIDRDSCVAVATGLALNHLPDQPIYQGSLLDALPAGGGFDLVIANLYAELLVELLADPRLVALLAGRGRLWVSGISAGKQALVATAAGSHGWNVSEWWQRDGWCAAVLQPPV